MTKTTILCLLGLVAATAKADPVTLHDYHPFRSVDLPGGWEERKTDIRDRVALAAGLLPFPEKTPLNAHVFGAKDYDGFKVEHVYFESFPGHYVTGNLFSPTGESAKIGLKDGKRPGVICVHGHWKEGRFYDAGGLNNERGALNQIADGGERFVSAARNPIIARSVQLARMGCIVFTYDTLGNADSKQLVEHRRGPRDSMNSPNEGEWGFVSPQATLRLQTNFGLQTWNSVRALDFLTSLENVDQDRLLVTGASGGGTQTMMLAAVDDRIDASFPAVMVSTAMQGGCTCENSHYLRIGQGNIDIAAAVAPSPLGLIAADDWTIELETKGHPDLVDLYAKLGAPKNYEAHFDIHFKHNYNHVARTHLYDFVNRHFDLGLETPVLESDYEFLDPDALGVWKNLGDTPEGYNVGDDHERDLNHEWARASDATMTDKAARRAWELILARVDGNRDEGTFELDDKVKGDGFLTMTGPIQRELGESIPTRFYYPEDWNGEVVIWLSREGTAGMHGGDPLSPIGPIQEALDAGTAVMGIDFTGPEANEAITYSGDKKLAEDSWQRSPVYLYGYNHPVFVRRVHDILDAVAMARTHPKWEVKSITLGGEPGSGHWAFAARLAAGEAVDKVDAEVGDFRWAKLNDVWDEDFVPGAVKYGDIETLMRIATGG